VAGELEFRARREGFALLEEVAGVAGLEADDAGDGTRAEHRGRGRAAQYLDLLVEVGLGEERAHAVLLVVFGGAVDLDDQPVLAAAGVRAEAADVEAL